MRLLDEAVGVWRPVKAVAISEHVFRLEETAVPTDERWSFAPGDEVVVEERQANGRPVLIAVARASDVDEPSAQWLRKAG